MLGLGDRGQQLDGALHISGQRGAAHGDTGVLEALVLAVQRQVVHELVDQQAGQEADVGQATLEHRARRRDFGQGRAGLVLDHWAAVLQHHVAARALRQAARDLVVDDLVLVGVGAGQLRRRQRDHLDRDVGAKAQALVADAGRIARLGHPPGVADLLGGDDRRRGGGVAEQRLEPELGGVIDQAALGFLPEELALEPRQTVVEGGDLLAQVSVLGAQLSDLRNVRFCRRNNDFHGAL